MEWRIFEYRQSIDDANATEPDFPRPPVIKGLLHNAFRDLIGINESTEVADLLAAAVPSLFATADPRLVDVALELQDLAVSIPEAISVSRLTASDALRIPVNRLPGMTEPPKLLFFRDQVQSFKVGQMKFTIVGPTSDELTDLKTGWVTWLRANRDEVSRAAAGAETPDRGVQQRRVRVSLRPARLERHSRLQGGDRAERRLADVHGGGGRQAPAADR